MNSRIIDEFRKLLDVNSPIIFIQDFDFARVDCVIKEAVGSAKIFEWNPATGATDFNTKQRLSGSEFKELTDFLLEKYTDEFFRNDRFLVLKEVHDYLSDPRIKFLLEMIAQRKLYDRAYSTTVIIVSSEDRIPDEVKKYVSYLDMEYPTDQEIDSLIVEHIRTNKYDRFNEDDKELLKLSLKGMSEFEIDRVLDMAISSNGSLTSKDTGTILEQKKQRVKKSGIVELINTTEDEHSIGGLTALKLYLKDKARVFREWTKAIQYGVAMPKGVFIVGMPGCGKSLCAKATANIFHVPLLKLDMGSMMGKYVGQSEENLRKAIRTAEAAAPCILWIDEIEKAFSNVRGENDVLARMFGFFLSWMQEKKSNVYVIATANNADNLPPELKRKGRFDEIFCVNLPNIKEREEIFAVHLNRLAGKQCMSKDTSIDIKRLAESTHGFNGADIESVVFSTVEKSFLADVRRPISTEMLLQTAVNTVSISKSCGNQIEAMKKVFRESSFKDATTGRMTN